MANGDVYQNELVSVDQSVSYLAEVRVMLKTEKCYDECFDFRYFVYSISLTDFSPAFSDLGKIKLQARFLFHFQVDKTAHFRFTLTFELTQEPGDNTVF